MPKPEETLADAYESDKRVTVTETDGTTHEDVVVEDFTRVVRATYEVWEFKLRGLRDDVKLFSTDLESVDVLE